MVSAHFSVLYASCSTWAHIALKGIYTSIIASIVILVVRIARPRGSVLGRVAVHGKDEKQSREIYVPMERTGSSREALVHPHLVVDPPLPGVIIFRPEESVLYPNAVLLTSGLFEYIKQNTRTGRDTSGIPVGLPLPLADRL